MKIVIDIDDDMYKQIMADDHVYVLDEVNILLIENAIYNGAPLPEHHGRLIDADKIMRVDHIVLESAIDNAPTIIERSDSECRE